jgi:hypothetical protein
MTPTDTTLPRGAVTHPKCGSRWVGRTSSHCAGCCESFSGSGTFDDHQSITSEDGLCRKPQDVGLVAVGREWGTLWCRPGTNGTPAADNPDGDGTDDDGA